MYTYCVANMSYVALVVESLNYGAGGPKPAHILLLLLTHPDHTRETHQSHEHHLNHPLSIPNQVYLHGRSQQYPAVLTQISTR